MSRAGLATAFAALVTTAGVARAETLSFAIYREDEAIGHSSYFIEKADGVTKVKAEVQTDATVLFIEFHYRSDRTEIWKDGHVESLISTTNDDGTKHQVDVHRDGDALVGTVDGAKKSAPGSALPFTLWNNEFLTAPQMFDVVDFSPLKVKIEDKGAESVKIGEKSVPSHHFKLTGDLVWDLWYGADGTLQKTAFRRLGYPIFFVRQ